MSHTYIFTFGGGRLKDTGGTLNTLSMLRLEEALLHYRETPRSKLVISGGKVNSYRPDAHGYPVESWKLKASFFLENNVKPADIIPLKDETPDTISELLNLRNFLKGTNDHSMVSLISSHNHYRVPLLARHILGEEYVDNKTLVSPWMFVPTFTGDVVDDEEEMKYFRVTESFLNSFGRNEIPFTTWDTWYDSIKIHFTKAISKYVLKE